MTLLTHATVEQLVEWQSAIVTELAWRAQTHARPVEARPPWEMASPQRPVPRYVEPAPAPELAPGVRATLRTDPKLAALFAQQRQRVEGVPGLNGNGRGEGEAVFGDG